MRLPNSLGRAAIVALAGLWAATAGHAEPNEEIAAAENLVRRTYYEGLPYAEARAVAPAAAARWVAMLGDPRERAHAATIAEALGIAAPPGAFEALVAADAAGASGEIDLAAYKLRRAIPLAMGHLARSDDRALVWLIAAAEREGEDPGWYFRDRSGPRLGEEQRLRAVAGLGLAGRPAAAAALHRLSARHGPSGVSDHARDALALNEGIAVRGADAVLGAPRRPRR